MTDRKRTGGFFLVVTVSVLTVLALLGALFASLSNIEQNITQNYTDLLRAELIAQAGVEKAIAIARSAAQTKSFDDSRPVSQGGDVWIFRNNDPETNDLKIPGTSERLDVGAGIPLVQSQNPSFELAGSNPPNSGILPGTYSSGGDFFVLKILDGASQINLNSSSPALGNMLNVLGQSVAAMLGVSDPIGGTGAQIVAYRNNTLGGSFRSEFQIQEALSSILGPSASPTAAQRAALLVDFVIAPPSLPGFVDQKTIQPNPQGSFPSSFTVQMQARSPINVNTASYPVLQTCLTEIAGLVLEPRPTGDEVVFEKIERRVNQTMAGNVARAIINHRKANGPFTNWYQFEKFVDEQLEDAGILGTANGLEAIGRAAVLKAMANPNTRLNKYIPNAPGAALIDKVDLVSFTTELCFGSMGLFELESLGRLLRQDGSEVARRRLHSTAQVFEVVRHTSQSDFETYKVPSFSSNVWTFPESISTTSDKWFLGDLGLKSASTIDGSVQLFGDSDNDNQSNQIFFAPFRTSLDALSSTGNASASGSSMEEGSSLLSISNLARDGVLCYAQAGNAQGTREDLTFQNDQDNMQLDTGSLEFWIKLPMPGNRGGSANNENEFLFFATTFRSGSEGTGQREGITWKLERKNGRLLSTRFFWRNGGNQGFLNGDTPYEHVYNEIDISNATSNWRSNEWHHIAHEWFEGTKQQLRVDGQPYSTTFSLPEESVVTKKGEGKNGGDLIITTRNRFRLVTQNDKKAFHVAGFQFTASQTQDVFQRSTQTPGTYFRFANCMIDNLRIYSNNKNGDYTLNRFPAFSTMGTYRGRFNLDDKVEYPGLLERLGWKPGVGSKAKVGTLSWTITFPTVWSDRTIGYGLRVKGNTGDSLPALDDDPYKTVDPHRSLPKKNFLDSYSTGNDPSDLMSGRGVPVNKLLGTNKHFTYEFSFRDYSISGSGGMRVISPILDDVTLTLIGEPKVLSWTWLTD